MSNLTQYRHFGYNILLSPERTGQLRTMPGGALCFMNQFNSVCLKQLSLQQWFRRKISMLSHWRSCRGDYNIMPMSLRCR